MTGPSRIVLDTNVWLDWLFFKDPSMTKIGRHVAHKRLKVIIDEACRDELKKVLAYPRFNVNSTEKDSFMRCVDEKSQIVGKLKSVYSDVLPICKDEDDQKFIELAYGSKASWLITRDKDLLKLRKKMLRLKIIVSEPKDWKAHELI